MSTRNNPHIDFRRKEGVLKILSFVFEPFKGKTVIVDPLGYTLKLGDHTYTGDASIQAVVVDNVLTITASVPAVDHEVGTYRGWLRSNTLVDGSYWEITLNMTVNERNAQ